MHILCRIWRYIPVDVWESVLNLKWKFQDRSDNSFQTLFFKEKYTLWKNTEKIDCCSKIVHYVCVYTKTHSLDFDRLIFCDTSGYALGLPMQWEICKYIPWIWNSLAMSTNNKDWKSEEPKFQVNIGQVTLW